MKDVCVVGGAGHVGFPLAVAFADIGLDVLIHDINEAVLNTISQGIVPFREEGIEDALKRTVNKTLKLSSKPEHVGDYRFVVVCIGTPVDEHLNPTYHSIKSFFANLKPYLRESQTVILRSTVYPGTTAKVRDLLKKDLPGIEVCFCPERIAEGYAWSELRTLPQIVSGFSDTSLNQVKELFSKITPEVIVTKPMEAELAKLFNNSWRYLEFAAANQFYMIAESAGVDFYNVFNAMTHRYPRAAHFPKPGFSAGPCLFKDTMQVSAFAQNTFFLGHSAMLVNEGFPNFLVEEAKKKHDLPNMTAGILGMAFKGESDDPRESLSYKLKKVLELEARHVLCSDVYIKSDAFVDEQTILKDADIIFIGAPHKRYSKLNYGDKILVNVWNQDSKGSKL